VSGEPRVSCFACGELNTPDSRFCKFCGRQLVRERKPPTVANDPRNRLMLVLVLVLIVACAAFGIFGLLTSKVFRPPASSPAAYSQLVAIS
jgi:hypothetical protein